MLPKIHKEGNPGRPIISEGGTLTEPISSYLDSLIKKIPPTHLSYLRDANHFLREINGLKIPEGAFLVTLDVTSVYTNIIHSDGIKALIESYNIHRADHCPKSQLIETLAKLELELNSFEFRNQYYLQIYGTAMGTRMASNYPNIFMNDLETKFLSTCTIKPYYYKRFLDDVFFIWTDPEKELIDFIESFNNVHPNIKFPYTYSKEINFLDVHINADNGSPGETFRIHGVYTELWE